MTTSLAIIAPTERSSPGATGGARSATPAPGVETPEISHADEAGPLIKEIMRRYRPKAGSIDALGVCLDLIEGRGEAEVIASLRRLAPAWRDHAIACVYAILMPGDRRKRLGAYFTPPHLVDHLISRLTDLGLDLTQDRLRDPAAGGAAFLVPLARRKVKSWRDADVADDEILTRLPAQLFGREIDPDLATLANALVRRMLTDEFHIQAAGIAALEIVATGDSLDQEFARDHAVDHEIGNPPYLRLPRALLTERQAEFEDIASGRLNLYAMFLRRAVDHVPPGGLVGYVIPASFLGGPEFTTFRSRMDELAEVLVVDIIEKRSDVFLDATQDACFVVLRRRGKAPNDGERATVSSGVLRADGSFSLVGRAVVEPGGEPWRLPGEDQEGTATLLTWGYRGAIGYLVANRQSERLHAEPGLGRYPLVWAKAIAPDGVFDFDRGRKHRGKGWVDAPATAPYIIRTECVAVQRTSSRGQKRRIAAALIPAGFLQAHGGVVAENHVILLVPREGEAWDGQALAEALNDPAASEQLDRMCGSASISVRLLEKLRLPRPLLRLTSEASPAPSASSDDLSVAVEHPDGP